MSTVSIRIGTRRSRLSRIQTQIVVDMLTRVYRDLRVEVIEFTTRGDIDLKRPIYRIPGTGVFVEELNRALIEGKIDLAIHSLKDYPTEYPEDLEIASIPIRDPAYDAIVPEISSIDSLDAGKTIGTSSLRRMAHLKYLNKELEIANVRGNIDTRLAKIGRDIDLLILSEAGLRRIGHNNYYRVPPDKVTPQAGQGAIAVVARKGSFAGRLARAINDPGASIETYVERSILRELGGGCKTPLGVFASIDKARGTATVYVSIVSRDFEERLLVIDSIGLGDPDKACREVIRKLEKEDIYSYIKEWRSPSPDDQYLEVDM